MIEPQRLHYRQESRPGVPLIDARIVDSSVASMVDYWRDIHPAPDRLPGRKHFDPMSVPKLLAKTWLVEIQRCPMRFRCRVYGTMLASFTGRDLTGRHLDDPVLGFVGSAAEADFMAVAMDGIGRWWRGPIAMSTPRCVPGVEVVMLPLASDGRTVDMILSCATFLSRSDIMD